VTRKYETAGKLLTYQQDSYSIVYAGFEYRMMVIGFSFYITVQKKNPLVEMNWKDTFEIKSVARFDLN